jgi:hypothetical protein
LFPYRIFTRKHRSVAFRRPCVYWRNDLEWDEVYANWSVTLDEFSEETKPYRQNPVTFVCRVVRLLMSGVSQSLIICVHVLLYLSLVLHTFLSATFLLTPALSRSASLFQAIERHRRIRRQTPRYPRIAVIRYTNSLSMHPIPRFSVILTVRETTDHHSFSLYDEGSG